jgi:hypothetical protein
MNSPNAHPIRDFIGGILLTIVAHVAFAILLGLLYGLFALVPRFDLVSLALYFWVAFIGISQIAYLVPLGFFFGQRSRREVCKGLVAGAILTLLLNGACTAMFWPYVGSMGSLGLAIGAGMLIGAGMIAAIGVFLLKR